MAKVYLSISSNFRAQLNINSALTALRVTFGELEVSNVYRNLTLHKVGCHYLNLVVCFVTHFDIHKLVAELKNIENSLGRVRGVMKIPQVSIDLDLLKYVTVDESIDVCTEITRRSFLLSPISEIAGHEIDKNSGLNYAALWQKFDKSIHPLEKVTLDL